MRRQREETVRRQAGGDERTSRHRFAYEEEKTNMQGFRGATNLASPRFVDA